MNHKEYWTKRINDVAQKQFDMTNDEMQKELKAIYESMANKMAKEVDDIYFRLLEDEITRTDIWTYKHYRDLSKRMSILAAKVGAREQEILNKQLEIALREVYKGTPLPGASFSLINETLIQQLIATPWSEKHFSQAVWDNKAKMLEILKRGLTESIVLGKSKDETVKKLRDLIISTNKNKGYKGAFADADRLVRSELMHIINEGQRQRYKDNGYTELEIYVIEDERLCEKCEPMNGKIVPIDSDEIPPIHSRCRCGTIPVVDWENTKNNVSNYGNSGIINSDGISGALSPNSKQADDHAKRYYESVRHMKTDIEKISKVTGWSKESIDKIKNHVFISGHDLGNGYLERFAPSYEMAQSWQRLILGDYKTQDVILLKHEYLELNLMRKGYSQYDAHIIASKKHNYRQEVEKGD